MLGSLSSSSDVVMDVLLTGRGRLGIFGVVVLVAGGRCL